MKFRRMGAGLLLGLGMLALLPGCAQVKEAFRTAITGESDCEDPYSSEFKPKYALGLYQIVKYPRAGKLESELTTFDGKTVWINTNQFFSSKNIEEVRLLPRSDRPDAYDLEVKLDRRGKILWSMLAANYRNEPMALLLDGIYVNAFSPQPLAHEDAEWVVIPGPFDAVTAAGILKYAKKNHEYFNPSATSWF